MFIVSTIKYWFAELSAFKKLNISIVFFKQNISFLQTFSYMSVFKIKKTAYTWHLSRCICSNLIKIYLCEREYEFSSYSGSHEKYSKAAPLVISFKRIPNLNQVMSNLTQKYVHEIPWFNSWDVTIITKVA